MIYDVSVLLRPGMPTYDQEPGPELSLIKTLEQDEANVSLLRQGTHTGTHVDAPVHFIPGGDGVDQLPIQFLVGPCLVVEIPGQQHISARDLEIARLGDRVERVFFKTQNSRFWREQAFRRDFRALRADAAGWLVEHGVRLVGIDYLSIDPYDAEPKAAHLTLLEAGVVVVEGLDLQQVPPGRYNVACLPLKLQAADGAPARVLLWDGDETPAP
jgi:arylformamidase